MSKRIAKLLVEDIIEAIEYIEEFSPSTYEELVKDKKSQRAILRNLEVIGETSNRIPKEFRDLYPAIE
ncbi:MAG: DUF86 domain-containing protein [Flammeovirgaceae bacterium]|nr:DUF86 domain-containing protein [Flammeovirgaceae bacterium]